MSKTILVTGGAGFVGSRLCARLVEGGHKIISLDNYFAGSRDNHVPGVEYREGHTKDIAALVPEKPDLIFHLGEYSRVAKSLEEPEIVFDLNIAGTLGVLNFWKATGSKLVYAGSSTKFVEAGPDGTMGKDLAPYTWAKAINTELIHNYGRWYDLPHSIAYFYNVYGEGERSGVNTYGTVVETFRQNYLTSTPMQVRSPGTQVRNFTHVDDTVSALILIGDKGRDGEYGISAKEAYSLLQLAQMFGGEIEMLPPTPTTRSGSGPMDTRELESLGWQQQHTLQEYILETKQQNV